LREPLWSTSVRTPRCPARADLYAALTAKLGPDPLREDADAERVWARMQASRKPVGLVLMDQSMIAGIGNIYRAEILFKARAAPGAHGKARPTRLSAPAQLSKRQRGSARFEVGSTPGGPPGGRRACTPSRRPARWTNAGWAAGRQAGVHPEQAANTVERGAFERIWAHSVELLRRGFQSGSILTVDPDEAKRLGKPWTRRRAPPVQPPALGAGIRQLRQTRGDATYSMASGCVPVPIKAGGSSKLDVYKMYRLLPRQPDYAPQVPRAATDTGVEARPGLWRARNGTACVLRVRRTRSPLPQHGGSAVTAGSAAGTSTTRRAAGAAAATCARGAWPRAPATRAPPASRCRPRPCWPPRAPRRWPPRRRPRWAAQARPACAPTWCSRMPVKQPARGMLGGVLRLLMAQDPESLCVASRFTCAAALAACRQL